MSIKAYDIDGTELQRNDLVEVVEQKDGFPHAWLRVGNKLRVAYWENRPFGVDRHVVVFLKSKKGGNLCQQGMHEKKLRKVVEK